MCEYANYADEVECRSYLNVLFSHKTCHTILVRSIIVHMKRDVVQLVNEEGDQQNVDHIEPAQGNEKGKC